MGFGAALRAGARAAAARAAKAQSGQSTGEAGMPATTDAVATVGLAVAMVACGKIVSDAAEIAGEILNSVKKQEEGTSGKVLEKFAHAGLAVGSTASAPVLSVAVNVARGVGLLKPKAVGEGEVPPPPAMAAFNYPFHGGHAGKIADGRAAGKFVAACPPH